MAFTDDDVRKLAKLARIAVADDEVRRLSHELGAIVGFVDRLQQVDVDGVEPLTHMHLGDTALRSDAAHDVRGADAVAGAADVIDAGDGGRYVRVPRVVD